jgi:hypothetical protein
MNARTIQANYGGAAVFAGSAVGGAIVSSFAQNKVAFLNTLLGKLLLIVGAILLLAKTKSDAVRGFATGMAVTGATGFVKSIAGSINGFEGLAGIDGDGGVGQIVQDENGMIYMMNGVGELEPYMVPMIEGVYGDEDYSSFAGVGAAIDEAIAAS